MKPRDIEWNKYALATIGLYTLYLITKFAANCHGNIQPSLMPPSLISCTSSNYVFLSLITYSRNAILGLLGIAGAIAGWEASRSFGGTGNFTGRLLFFVSVGLIFAEFVPGVLIYLQFPYAIYPIMRNPLYVSWLSSQVLLSSSGLGWWTSLLGQCFPTYALIVGLWSVRPRFDLKSLLFIVLSLIFALITGWVNLVYLDPMSLTTTVTDTILWVGLFPLLGLLQLVAAVLLLRALGRWYVAKSLAAMLVTYLMLTIFFQISEGVVYVILSLVYQISNGVIFSWVFDSSVLAANFWLGFVNSSMLFVLCMILTQIKPRTTGKYF